jgi:hypothetical protein
MSYADAQDYTDYTGKTAPADIDLRLRRASAQVDAELLSAVYDTTDPYVIAALRDATCEQAHNAREGGYSGGGASGGQDVKIGSVAIGARSSANSGALPGQVPFSSVARTILQVAGVSFTNAPMTDDRYSGRVLRQGAS